MTTPLMDSLSQVTGRDFASKLATHLDEPEQNVTRGLGESTTSMLAGLVSKTGDSQTMQQVFGMVTNSANDGRLLDNPASLIGATNSPLSSLGGDFTSRIFGSRSSAVNDIVAKSSGLRPASVLALMRLAAPLLLGVLGRRVRDGSLNAASFTQFLAGERDKILAAAPSGLTAALGGDQRVPLAGETVPVREAMPVRHEAPVRDVPLRDVPRREPVVERNVNIYASRDRIPVDKPSSRGWLWPAVAAVGALALLFGLWPRHHDVAPIPTAAVDTTRIGTAGGEIATPAAPVVAAGMVTISLPNGTSFDVPATSSEARLNAFLVDPTRTVDDTTWFELDQLRFGNNSSKLLPESDAQLKRISQIMAAYPNASAKIGGYTDNVGSEAKNVRLSQSRAASAKQALIGMGVGASRLSSEGYGSAHPVADNSTADGQAQNRRIALRVTQK